MNGFRVLNPSEIMLEHNNFDYLDLFTSSSRGRNKTAVLNFKKRKLVLFDYDILYLELCNEKWFMNDSYTFF